MGNISERQLLAYPDSARGFIQTRFYWLHQLDEDTSLTEIIIKYPPPKRIISFPEVHRSLIN
jgi:hypothetical protein